MQIRRVTKVVKGGKQLSFRAVVSGGMRHGCVLAHSSASHAMGCLLAAECGPAALQWAQRLDDAVLVLLPCRGGCSLEPLQSREAAAAAAAAAAMAAGASAVGCRPYLPQPSAASTHRTPRADRCCACGCAAGGDWR